MNLQDIEIDKLIQDFYENQADTVPFGNSDFQEIAFNMASQHTPERIYRAVIMQQNTCLKGLKEAYFQLQREDLEIEELESELKKESSGFRGRRLEIDLQEKRLNRIGFLKLVNDSLHTFNLLNEFIAHIPKPTREQFELAEPFHFHEKLTRSKDLIGQYGASSGPIEALMNMSEDLQKLIGVIPEAKNLLEDGLKNLLIE